MSYVERGLKTWPLVDESGNDIFQYANRYVY